MSVLNEAGVKTLMQQISNTIKDVETKIPEAYDLPQATSNKLGGVKIGYSSSGRNYAMQLNNSGQAYVNVPWTDTKAWTSITSRPALAQGEKTNTVIGGELAGTASCSANAGINHSFIFGYNNQAYGDGGAGGIFGQNCHIYDVFDPTLGTNKSGNDSFFFAGRQLNGHAGQYIFGKYNETPKLADTSGQTAYSTKLFVVANGSSQSQRHDAFYILQNGSAAFCSSVSATSFIEGNTSLSNKYLGKGAKAESAKIADKVAKTLEITFGGVTESPLRYDGSAPVNIDIPSAASYNLSVNGGGETGDIQRIELNNGDAGYIDLYAEDGIKVYTAYGDNDNSILNIKGQTAGKTLGMVKTTSTVINIDDYTAAPIVNGVVYYKDTDTGITKLTYGDGVVADIHNRAVEIPLATGTTDGIMSAADKDRLDGLPDLLNDKYVKPATGIPKNDLAQEIQASLTKADSALQSYTDTGATSIEVTGTGIAIAGASYNANTRKITLTKDLGKINWRSSSSENTYIENKPSIWRGDYAQSYSSKSIRMHSSSNQALGNYATAMGSSTSAKAYSFAGGNTCNANATYCFLYGQNLMTDTNHQTVFGKYNDKDANSAFILGWGSSGSPKNIFTISTTGNVTATSFNGHTIAADVPSNAKFTDTTYSIATNSKAGLVKPINIITKPTINDATATAGKYYHVQMSSDGSMFVNVPWQAADNISGIVDIEYRLTGQTLGITPPGGYGYYNIECEYKITSFEVFDEDNKYSETFTLYESDYRIPKNLDINTEYLYLFNIEGSGSAKITNVSTGEIYYTPITSVAKSGSQGYDFNFDYANLPGGAQEVQATLQVFKGMTY